MWRLHLLYCCSLWFCVVFLLFLDREQTRLCDVRSTLEACPRWVPRVIEEEIC